MALGAYTDVGDLGVQQVFDRAIPAAKPLADVLHFDLDHSPTIRFFAFVGTVTAIENNVQPVVTLWLTALPMTLTFAATEDSNSLSGTAKPGFFPAVKFSGVRIG